jgi:hypothetical protein
MKLDEAQDMARRIIEAAPEAERSPQGLLEQIFGREGSPAIAAALAFWALSSVDGEAPPDRVDAVASALLVLLQPLPELPVLSAQTSNL